MTKENQKIEVMERKFVGEVHDTIICAKTGKRTPLDISYNVVVDRASILFASLLKGEAGFTGIGFWEVGSGSSTWSDDNPPSPLKGDSTLLVPTFRKAILPADIKFITPADVVTTTPTNRLEVKVKFGTAEANGHLREFGIFGGKGAVAGTLGSGYMINRKIHGTIFKTSDIELERIIRFTF